jgi:hypothetical protein
MTPFERAQQAANAAYTMTLEQTGDEAQAAVDYKSVMDAYNAAATLWSTNAEREVWKAEAERAGAELAAEKVCDFRDWQRDASESMLEMTRRIWRETEPIEYD